MNKPVITEADLHASVDGHSPASARAQVDAWLLEHPVDANRVASYRQQNEALHAAYDDVLDEPVPASLMNVVQRRPRRFAPMRYAAVIAWFAVGGVVGGVVGWKGHDVQVSRSESVKAAPAFVRQAAVAHAVFSPEVRHPVEVGASDETHLVAWLSKRLGVQLRVPHLGEQGYALVGGRLLPGTTDERAPVAQFMYQDGKGARLTLYVRVDAAASRETAFRYAQDKNLHVFYWVDQKLGYALSGEIEKPELLRVANAVYKQLNP